jgi:mono/diheme cytochrome c family protein
MRPGRIGILVACLAAAARAQSAPDDEDFFEKRVRPIFVRHCFDCHGAGAPKPKGGLRLDSRDGLLKGGSQGPSVVPGDPARSLLVRAVRGEDEDLEMPPDGRLEEAQIRDLEEWVRRGAPGPRAAPPPPEGARPPPLWSLVRPKPVVPPEVRRKEWPVTPIDRFVLNMLEERGLSPSPEADPATLLRRLTFDLTGLPPSPEEVEAFVGDPAPDAYERAVDRLLASPRYGERWGRYWLDVARYSDTPGRDLSRRFPYAYTYRDWVIRAFNEDLPYDRFILFQLAADRVEGAGRDALAALGFLTVGRGFESAHDVIDDRIDVVTRGFLGLSVSCARCHDHKFDPVPTADYYSLYAVFAGSREPAELPLLDPTAPEAVRRAYEAERSRRQDELDAFLAARLADETRRLRRPETVAAYLEALAELKDLPQDQRSVQALQRGLNPDLLARWAAFLANRARKHDPVFAPWHAFVKGSASPAVPEPVNPFVARLFERPATSVDELARRYGELLSSFAKDEPLPGADGEALRQVLCGPGAPAAPKLPEMIRRLGEAERKEMNRLQAELDTLLATHPGAPGRAMVLEDLPKPPARQKVFLRGEPTALGEEVPRRFLACLSGPQRVPFATGSGRLDLARAIASPDNPLTARVMVNRVWRGHFGEGLVRTPSDFGTQGEPPSHPELLDWLAREFVAQGWSVKRLHRLILRSATYRQSSRAEPGEAPRVDPENRLLWRANRRRLDLEAMRDSLLFAAGRLDLTAGGRSVELIRAPFPPRRSVYGHVNRQSVPEFYRIFDFPSADFHAPARGETILPQQALFLMNSPFVTQQAEALSRRPDVLAGGRPRRGSPGSSRSCMGARRARRRFPRPWRSRPPRPGSGWRTCC